jgi:hypothetical protein
MLFLVNPRFSWKNGLGIQDPKTITVDEQGIASKGSAIELRLSWSQIESAIENTDYFIATPMGRSIAIFIPKRALRSKGDEEELRALFVSYVPTFPNK